MNSTEYKEWRDSLSDEEQSELAAKKKKVHRKRSNAKRSKLRKKLVKSKGTATPNKVYTKTGTKAPKGHADYKPTVKDQTVREKVHVSGSEFIPTAYVADTRSKPDAVRVDRVNPDRIGVRADLKKAKSNKDIRLARMAKRTARKLSKKAA